MALSAMGDRIFVADAGCSTIRTVSTIDGSVSTLAGGNSSLGIQLDGIGTAAAFTGLGAISIGTGMNSGMVFVADSGAIRQVTSDGTVTTVTATVAAGDPALGTTVNGMTQSAGDVLYISDTLNNCIRAFDVHVRTLTTLAGLCGSGGYADGSQGSAVRFNNPQAHPRPDIFDER